VSALAALAVTGRPPTGAGAAGPAASREPILAQTPAGPPDAPRVMAFTWTLYAGMWAELDSASRPVRRRRPTSPSRAAR
jgi:hypothetical protein